MAGENSIISKLILEGKLARSEKWLLGSLGLLLVAASLSAWKIGDLRKDTLAFEWVFFSAFILYGLASFWALGKEQVGRRLIIVIFTLAVAMQAILVFTHPTLSDDMFRYVWDGRVQAHGISPYRYPPDAPQLVFLRDAVIYPSINRDSAVTVYPPAAEAAYVLLWRIWPDNIHWFQAVMAAGGLLGGILLVGLLHDLGRTASRVLIYLWSPLLVFETAHAGHIDGLMLPLLVGAWWARVRERDGLTGFLLGIATAMKFYPALILPFLWRPRHPRGRWTMPLAFGSTIGLFYLPYWLTSGASVLGYLPDYFREKFNIGPMVAALIQVLGAVRISMISGLTLLELGALVVAALWCVLHPALDAETALRRCIWPIGIVTLLSQNLFSWYMLWLLPLVAIFMQPSSIGVGWLRLPRVDAWTGWWLFCGLIGLSYTFFIKWTPVSAAIQAQFFPLYGFLLISLIIYLWKKFASPFNRTSIQPRLN